MGQVFLNGGGTTASASGASGIPTSICSGLREKRDGVSVKLQWKDPDDTVIDNQVLCTWAKTIIVRKSGSLPENEKDGTVVAINTTRNAYDLTPFEDTLPDEENDYFYRAFPVSVNGVVNLDPRNRFGQMVFEFIINQNDSNPATCVKYLGENKDFKPAFMNYSTGKFDYGDWGNAFFMSMFKPCMLNPDGTIKHYLIANQKVDNSFDCYTHLKPDGTLRDVIYRSIYDGCNISNKIRSLSGQAICKTVAGDTQINYAKANGTGWDVDEYNVRRLINYLLILIGKSLDTQTVFGTGRYSGGSNSNNNQLNTGTLDKKGMFFGDNANGAVKVFHIENWWGNIWKITNGVIQKNGKLLYKMCEGTLDGSSVENYNTDGTGYIDSGVTASGTVSECYIKRMVLVPGIGLVPTADGGGSSSTYFCDGWWSNSTVIGFARFGSSPANGFLLGAFAFIVSVAVSYSSWYCGVSLSYKPS